MNGYFRNKISKLQEADWSLRRQRLVLTQAGRFFADEVAQQFQNPTYMPYPPDHTIGGRCIQPMMRIPNLALSCSLKGNR